MAKVITKELRDTRREVFAGLRQTLEMSVPKEDRLMYYHPSEEHIILTHALFLVLSRSLRGSIAKEKFVLLLREFQEEMLESYVKGDEYYQELLSYCNTIYEMMPVIIGGVPQVRNQSEGKRLLAISIVAGGYGGDIDDEECTFLVRDISLERGRVKCREIELLLPILERFIQDEMRMLGR